jgi:hypothetical protein
MSQAVAVGPAYWHVTNWVRIIVHLIAEDAIDLPTEVRIDRKVA